jgi:hypothetical protein
MKNKILLLLLAMFLSVGLGAKVATAVPPTGAEIETSIQKGLVWLASEQKTNGKFGSGYWGYDNGTGYTNEVYRGGQTGLILTKFAERAHELGQNPFDTTSYQYARVVIDGFQWLIDQMYSSGGGLRIDTGNSPGYITGLAMTAMAATKAPGRVHGDTDGDGDVDANDDGVASGPAVGWTYDDILQGLVTYSEFAQQATGAMTGGWHYQPNNGGDNSPCGYTVLGLRAAEAANNVEAGVPTWVSAFTINIATLTKTRLKTWVDLIQVASGGSEYEPGRASPGVNLLKTGNLLFQAPFAASDDTVPASWYQSRVDAAMVYIQSNWGARHDGFWTVGWRSDDSLNLQTMYNLMKGFASVGIDEITVGGNTIDWFGGSGQFAERLVATQNQTDGSWTSHYDYGGKLAATAWALLTLEKLAPPAEIRVEIDLDSEFCLSNNSVPYSIDITYTSETANVEGTVTITKNTVPFAVINLGAASPGFKGTTTKTYTNIPQPTTAT